MQQPLAYVATNPKGTGVGRGEAVRGRPHLHQNADGGGGHQSELDFSPIDLSLVINWQEISLYDPFFQITPHATGRLRSLFFGGPSANIRVIISHLSHPAPLLERLSICCSGKPPYCDFVLKLTPFNGDLPSFTCCVRSAFTPSCLGGKWTISPVSHPSESSLRRTAS